MDTVFDNVSRFLAQPRPRRATLRIVAGSAAGAALTAMFPKYGYAWDTTTPCNANTCPSGQVCCDWTTSSCCTSSTCLKNAAGQNVCCTTGKVCGNICCGPLETCCGSGTSSVCCETLSGKAVCKSSSTGVAVCERVPAQTCDQTVCSQTPGFTCVNGLCKCDETTCNQLGALSEVQLTCATTTGTCGPPGT